MKKNFLKGAGILTLATFFAKIIGAFYRIPLTNILGAEGMGVYQLIFPVYSFLLGSSSGALPIAISILVSRKITDGKEEEAKGLLHAAVSALLMTGVLISLALVALSAPISRLQGNAAARMGYLAIAPAIFFVSGVSVLRGWFQGRGTMAPSAMSQVCEGLGKLAVGLTLAAIFMRYGIAWAVFGAMIGVTVSEAITFVALYAIYRRRNPPFKLSFDIVDARRRYKEILQISLPITIGGMILPVTQFVDSFLVINLLTRTAAVNATASYGLYTAYVNTLITLPIVLTLSLGIAVIPQLGKDKAERNLEQVKQKSDTALKLALVIGVPFSVFYIVMPQGILHLLYPSLAGGELAQAARLLQIEALTVVTLSVTQINTSILQGLGDTYRPVKNMAVGAVLRILLNVLLLPVMGIYGVAVSSLVCFALTAVLNYLSSVRLTGRSPKLYKNSGVILLSGGILCGIVITVNAFTAGRLATVLTAAAGGLLYLVCLLFLKAFNEHEIRSLPFGNKLAEIFKRNER
jgi:stage V sporulation protein B